jgi:hypothetical protein
VFSDQCSVSVFGIMFSGQMIVISVHWLMKSKENLID